MSRRKVAYHINGTTRNFYSRKELAKYLNCTAGAIGYAEKRWCKEKGYKSFWLKNLRIKRIKPIQFKEQDQ